MGLIILGLISLNANIFAQTTVRPDISAEQTITLETPVTETEKVQNEMKSKLSTLWTAVTLNMITADVLGLYIPEGRDDFTEFADGKEAELMLGGAIMYQIPISMVVLSKVLPYEKNRKANIIASGLMAVAIVAGGTTDPHYIVLAGAELVWLTIIARTAWKWPNPEGKHNDKKHDISLNMNVRKTAYGITANFSF